MLSNIQTDNTPIISHDSKVCSCGGHDSDEDGSNEIIIQLPPEISNQDILPPLFPTSNNTTEKKSNIYHLDDVYPTQEKKSDLVYETLISEQFEPIELRRLRMYYEIPPFTVGHSITGYTHNKHYNMQLSDCIAENRPYYVVPSSLEYECNPIKHFDAAEYLDTVPSTANRKMVEKVNEKLNATNDAIELTNKEIIKKNNQIQSITTMYLMAQHKLTNSTNLSPIVTVSSTMDPVIRDSIAKTNELLKTNPTELKKQIAIYNTAINQLKNQIEELIIKNNQLEARKIKEQEEVLVEQTKYIHELARNPPKVLSADEVIRNYLSNQISMESDGYIQTEEF